MAPQLDAEQIARLRHKVAMAAIELVYRWQGAGEPLSPEELAALQVLVVNASQEALLNS